MTTMNVPGFTADVTLERTMGTYHSRSIGVSRSVHNEVIAQRANDYSYDRANAVKNIFGFGRVICVPDCSGIGSGSSGPQFCREVCAWWPY
jgi:hypothetical protein